MSIIRKLSIASLIAAANIANGADAPPQPMPLFSKQDAIQALKQHSRKWKGTDLIVEDATNLKAESDAMTRLHVGLLGQAVVSRADLSRYGIANANALDVFNFESLLAEFELTLFDKKAKSQQEAAASNVEASNQNRQHMQDDLVALTLLNYLNVQHVATKLQIVEESIQRDQNIIQMAEAKIKSGTGISTDVMRARALLNMDKLKQIQLFADSRKAIKDLCLILGVAEIKNPLEPLPSEIKSLLPNQNVNVDLRSDIKASRLTIEAADHLKLASDYEFSPKVVFSGDAGGANSNLFPNNLVHPVGSVGIQVRMPFLDGGYFTAKKQQAVSDLLKAQLQDEELHHEAENQITTAVDQLKTAEAAARLAWDQVHLAEEELKLIRRRFQTGSANGLDLYTSQGNLTLARNTQADILFAYESSKLNYYRSIGNTEGYLHIQ